MDSSSPSSTVHGISQGRILEWVAFTSSRGSSQPRDRTCVSCVSYTAGGFFTAWATEEALSQSPNVTDTCLQWALSSMLRINICIFRVQLCPHACQCFEQENLYHGSHYLSLPWSCCCVNSAGRTKGRDPASVHWATSLYLSVEMEHPASAQHPPAMGQVLNVRAKLSPFGDWKGYH